MSSSVEPSTWRLRPSSVAELEAGLHVLRGGERVEALDAHEVNAANAPEQIEPRVLVPPENLHECVVWHAWRGLGWKRRRVVLARQAHAEEAQSPRLAQAHDPSHVDELA